MSRKVLRVVFAILVVVGFINAQIFYTARSISLGGAYSMYDTGPDALLWNPANLGYEDMRFGLSFGVFPLVPIGSLYFSNNSINASWFNRYMTSGLYLDDKLKEEMLGYFPDSGLNISGEVCGRVFGLRLRHFALAMNVHMISSGNIPKDLFNVVFEGVKIEESIDLEDMGVFALGYLSLDMGYGRLLRNELVNRYFEKFAVGVAFRVLLGAGTIVSEDVSGAVSVFKDGIAIESSSTMKLGTGGLGMGIGAGVSGKIKGGISFGVSANNLFSYINWGGFAREYEFEYRNFMKPEDFFSDRADSLFEAGVISDTLRDAEAFATVLPPYLVIGLGYDFAGKVKLYADMVQFISEDWYSSQSPRFSLGVELRYLPVIPVRFGVSVGGRYGFRWGAGFGIGGRVYSFDFGFSQDSGFFNNAKGFIISFGHEFRF